MAWLKHLAEGRVPWALPVFCLGEFVRVCTHRSVFTPPSTMQQALAALDALLKSPMVRVLSPTPRFPHHLADILLAADARGNLAFDAQIAAVCRDHGVGRLLTEDRDFARFTRLDLITLGEGPGV